MNKILQNELHLVVIALKKEQLSGDAATFCLYRFVGLRLLGRGRW